MKKLENNVVKRFKIKLAIIFGYNGRGFHGL